MIRKEFCTLSDLVEYSISLLEEGEEMTSIFQTRDMKQLLMAHYGESITIASTSRVNESDLVFSFLLTAAELAVKLNNLDKLREAAFE